MESAATSAHLWEGRAARCLSCSRRWTWARCRSCRWHTPPQWSPAAAPSFWRTPGGDAQARALIEPLRNEPSSLYFFFGVINSLLCHVKCANPELMRQCINTLVGSKWLIEMNHWLAKAAAGLIRHNITYLERVWRLLLSVQWLQRVQELRIHSEYPLVISCYRQVSVVRRQAVELDSEQQVYLSDRKLKLVKWFIFSWDLKKAGRSSHW